MELLKKRIGKILVFVLITYVIVKPCMTVYADETKLQLYAKAAVLMDADSGRVLYGKNENQLLAMASTTKIMTLIIALENADLEDKVKVSAYAASMPDVQLGMREGEEFLLKDLTYSLMLESHNDTAVAIAEHVGGSVEDFADMMNGKAREIGCENTFYITPNGLDGEDGEKFHSTTARDLALVMSYCITKSPQKDKFLEITRTPSHTFSNLSGTRHYSCNNHNAFLNMMEGALSGKTGFTSKAGYCYVGALKRDEKTFVVALLACGWPNHKTYKWADTKLLMNYGLDNYEYRAFDSVGLPAAVSDKIMVKNAKSSSIGQEVYIGTALNESGKGAANNTGQLTSEIKTDGILMKNTEKIDVRVYRKKYLDAPVKKGERVGYISYMLDDTEWKRVWIVAESSADKIDFGWCLEQVLGAWSVG